MRRWRRSRRRRPVELRAQDGTATLEFIAAGAVLLIPLVYLALALGAVQSATLAAEGAARQAARVYVRAVDARSGTAAAERAVTIAFADARLPRSADALRLSGDEDEVVAEIRAEVRLPLVPALFGLERVARIPIEAVAAQPRSMFGEGR